MNEQEKENSLPLREKLAELGLDTRNSIVIGSGVMEALGIRRSGDVDLVVAAEAYERLKAEANFKEEIYRGRPILAGGRFEIGKSWEVLGSTGDLPELRRDSTVIGGVRYVSLEFLLRVKRSWLLDKDVRQKDRDDVELIERYLESGGRSLPAEEAG